MGIKKNIKGNGYILTGPQKNREKIILQAIRSSLVEHPGEAINVCLKDDEIVLDIKNNIQNDIVSSKTKKYK